MVRRCALFATQWAICGGRCCAAAARETTCRGDAGSVTFSAGSRPLRFVILILSCAWASSPKVGAGCGNAARPCSVEGVMSDHDPYSDFWFASVWSFGYTRDVALTLNASENRLNSGQLLTADALFASIEQLHYRHRALRGRRFCTGLGRRDNIAAAVTQ